MFLSRYPLFLVLVFQTGLAMLVPSVHALALGEFSESRIFFYAALLLILVASFVGIALQKHTRSALSQRDQLLILFGAFVGLPLLMAIPFQEAAGNLTYFEAYFEMVSSFTTTGASIFADPKAISLTLHLWRAEVAWLGGYVMLVAAAAILAPMHLGGYEVLGAMKGTRDLGRLTQSEVREGANARIGRWSQKIFPVYFGLTMILWFGLFVTGQDVTVALSHAMSILSTSGISPLGGLENTPTGVLPEFLMFVFLFAGLSRMTLLPDHPQGQGLWHDREFRIGVAVILLVPTLILARHWLAALDAADGSLVGAIWGGVFTTLSFLTTTGFVSQNWSMASAWSGHGTMEIVLIGLAIVGGGVATTAGGVKLLRVYALFGQGMREMDRLVFPSAIGQGGIRGRRITREGTHIAWIFFMLFAVTLAVVMTGLSLLGVGFEQAAILAVSALSTTGPLATYAGVEPILIGELQPLAQAILMATMVIGRLEALALIALFNPDFWRG